jgi:tRNA pseudouridine38-40 synthase
MCIERIALGIEYQGSKYHGWQKQDSLLTIQGLVEAALAKVANHAVELFCAGRTDAGVHAIEQVAHFDAQVKRSAWSWVMGTNNYLPPDIRVKWAKVVPESFHARFSATARQYRYLINNQRVPSALKREQTLFYPYPLQIELMRAGADHLIGQHDFSSFRGSDCQAKTALREVKFIEINQENTMISLDIKANAFLHHMVRNIVGVLLEVGNGNRNPEWVKEVLNARSRTVAGITAGPEGLYLLKVNYPCW